MHLVDQAQAQAWLDDVDAATDPNVLVLGSLAGPRQGHGGAFGHKVKGGAAFHDQQWAGMVFLADMSESKVGL